MKSFPEPFKVFIQIHLVQLCVIHKIHNSVKYVDSKNQKELLNELKCVYQAENKESAKNKLLKLEEKLGDQYPIVIRS